MKTKYLILIFTLALNSCKIAKQTHSDWENISNIEKYAYRDCKLFDTIFIYKGFKYSHLTICIYNEYSKISLFEMPNSFPQDTNLIVYYLKKFDIVTTTKYSGKIESDFYDSVHKKNKQGIYWTGGPRCRGLSLNLYGLMKLFEIRTDSLKQNVIDKFLVHD